MKTLIRTAMAMVLASCTASAASFTVGGFTWDSDNAVTTAAFTEGGPGFIAVTTFPEGSRSIGNLVAGQSPAFVDITNTITNADRHTITMSWAGAANGSRVPNTPGDDLVIYETGSAGAPEAYAIAVRDSATSLYSLWHYYKSVSFDVSASAFATPIDLSDFGAGIASIDQLAIRAIFNSAGPNGGDRVDLTGGTGEGVVAFDVGAGNFTNRLLEAGPQGPAGEFAASRLDADIVYVVSLNNTIPAPEPTLGLLIGLGAMTAFRRRKNRSTALFAGGIVT